MENQVYPFRGFFFLMSELMSEHQNYRFVSPMQNKSSLRLPGLRVIRIDSSYKLSVDDRAVPIQFVRDRNCLVDDVGNCSGATRGLFGCDI